MNKGEVVWSRAGYWLNEATLSSHLAVITARNDKREIQGSYLLSFRTGDVEYFPYDQTDPNLVELRALNKETIILADTEREHYMGYTVPYE